MKFFFLTLFLPLVFSLNAISGPSDFRNKRKTWFLEARPCWAARRQTEQNLTLALHKMVTLEEVESARFHITGASNFRLFLNGEFLGFGPSIAAHGYFRVDEYDLTGHLQKGENILAIEATGYNVPNYYIPNQSSFIQAELVVNGKVRAATLTGDSPLAFTMGIPGQRVQEVSKYTFQRPHREVYRLEPGYNDWKTARNFVFEKTTVEETDRKNLLPRHVKYPDYSIKEAWRNPENGIFTFEKNFTGFIRAEVKVNTPSKIILYWDEILDKGTINRKRKPHAKLEYTLAPGHYSLESYEPYTLKYLGVEVMEGDCSVNGISLRQYVNSDVDRAHFLTDDEGLNSIFDAAVETFKQNALDVFMDCPSRERAGWLCDSYFTARVAYDLSGNTLIEHNFLENFLLPEKFDHIPEGMLPMCYPSDHPNGNFIPNWAMWFVLQLDEYVQRSGDYEMLVQLKPRVLKLLEYFKRFENKDGLLEDLEKWIFVEWSKANDFVQDVNYPTNMLYSRVLETIGRLYNIPRFRDQARELKANIRQQAFRNGFFADNAIRRNGELVVQDNSTEVCQYFAFYFGIASPESHPELWERLIHELGPQRKEPDPWAKIHPANAFVGNYIRLELLAANGLTRQLAEECRDLFLYMAQQTGTLWENIYPGSSCCHGFASHVAHVFYRDLAGLSKIDRINRKVTIRFSSTGLSRCEATVPAEDEVISFKWEKQGDKLVYELQLPSGYSLEVENNSGLSLIREHSIK
jgi:hypothetical protein